MFFGQEFEPAIAELIEFILDVMANMRCIFATILRSAKPGLPVLAAGRCRTPFSGRLPF